MPRRPSSRSSASVVGSGLGQSLFPAFQERDFLMHWVGVPSTSDAETVRTTTAVSKELRAIPGRAQLRGPHRPGPARRGGLRGQLRRELDQPRSRRRLHQGPGGDRRGRREVPRPLRRGPDLPRRAHRGGAHRRQGADHRPRVRRGPRRAAREVRRGPGRPRPRSPASRTRTPTSRRTSRRSRCEVDAGQGREVRPQARRRPPSRRDPGRRRGGRRHLPRRPGLRRRRVEHPGDPVAT